MSTPFRDGLHQAFTFAIAICLIAALASWSRGARTPEKQTPQEVPARP
jgi:cbb3-type cytochrome oxidase subunit 3